MVEGDVANEGAFDGSVAQTPVQPAEENTQLRDERKSANQPVGVHRCGPKTDLLAVLAIRRDFEQSSKMAVGAPVEATGGDVLVSPHAIRGDCVAGAVRRRGASHPAGRAEAQDSLQDAGERRLLLLDARPPYLLQYQCVVSDLESGHQAASHCL